MQRSSSRPATRVVWIGVAIDGIMGRPPAQLHCALGKSKIAANPSLRVSASPVAGTHLFLRQSLAYGTA